MRTEAINLTFHGIGEAPGHISSAERELWVSVSQFCSVLDSTLGRGDVRITFDDGNASDVERALPALRQRGLKATFFIVAGRLGEPGYVDETGVRALADAGMTVGSHGMRHVPWRGLDDRTLDEEHVEARRLLEEVISRPVAEAACPFGSYDRRVLRSLRRSGYQRVYTSDGGAAGTDAWLQARTSIHRGNGDIARLLARETQPQRAVRRAKLVVKRWR